MGSGGFLVPVRRRRCRGSCGGRSGSGCGSGGGRGGTLLHPSVAPAAVAPRVVGSFSALRFRSAATTACAVSLASATMAEISPPRSHGPQRPFLTWAAPQHPCAAARHLPPPSARAASSGAAASRWRQRYFTPRRRPVSAAKSPRAQSRRPPTGQPAHRQERVRQG